jgi:drug/metabolite transporter (DMT)-like permease
MPTTLLIIAVLLRIISNPAGNVFQKQLTQSGSPPLVVNFLTYFFLGIVCIFFALRIQWTLLPAQFWIYSVLGGIVGASGNAFLVKALEKGDLSVLGPVNAYKSVIGIITGIFLLGEIPNIWGGLGVVLIIYGSYFVLDTTEDRFSWSLFKRKEIQFRLWAMVLTAVEAVFTKKVILASSPLAAFISWCWFGALFSFVLLIVAGIRIDREIKKIPPAGFKKYFFLLACIGTMQFTTNEVLQYMPVGYALSLFQLSTVVSVLLGHRVFKEQEIAKKLLGTVIMMAGSALVILMR